jgi:hypothetical protein
MNQSQRSARFAPRDVNASLWVKALLGHAAVHGTLGDLRAHIRRRGSRYLRFRRLSAALLQGRFIRRPIRPDEGWLGRIGAANQQRTHYRQ